MKSLNIYVKTIEHAKNVLQYYDLKTPEYIKFVSPMPGSYGRWTAVWFVKNKYGFGVINMILFPTMIKLLVKKYGKTIEDELFSLAIKTKETGLVKQLWKMGNKETKTKLMANVLGNTSP